MRAILLCSATSILFALAACGREAPPIEQSYGENPQLPEPESRMLPIPVINEAEAIGFPQDGAPLPAEGLAVARFAEGLIHPRWIHVLPNGDVLVAEASSLPMSGKGIVGWVMERVMRNAGAVQDVSPDRIVLLRDTNGDGVADVQEVFLDGLHQPFGMQLLDGWLYIANTDALVRVPYRGGETRASAPPELVVPLPYNPEDNGHWTRNVIASPDGSRLYVTVGTVSNVGELGMEIEQGRAAIHVVDPQAGTIAEFATGIRNPNGMGFAPGTDTLWTVVNERDDLGDNLVPDYLTSVQEGGFYGWPWVYWGDHMDPRFEPGEVPTDLANRAIAPDYALGGHTAALGLTFYEADLLPEQWRGGAFIGLHGSWNRREPSGYKVIYVPFQNGRPSGLPVDVLTGFLNEDGEAMGRPVGVAVDRQGALLVADDVGKIIWRVAPEGAAVQAPQPITADPGPDLIEPAPEPGLPEPDPAAAAEPTLPVPSLENPGAE